MTTATPSSRARSTAMSLPRPCRAGSRRSRRSGAPGVKTSATPCSRSSSASSRGIVPPTTTSTSSAPFSFRPSRIRGTSVMCAPERIEIPTASASSWIAVSTICSGRLVQAGVDDLHAGVAQRAGDDLGAAVVTVEAGLRDHDTNLSRHFGQYRNVKLTVVGSSPAWPNPGGAQSGYLIEGPGRLLLDCGPGVLARLRELLRRRTAGRASTRSWSATSTSTTGATSFRGCGD